MICSDRANTLEDPINCNYTLTGDTQKYMLIKAAEDNFCLKFETY